VLDWLVVGGGVHGTHLALALRRRGGVPAHRLRVLDPHPEPLAAWRSRADNVGMPYLRSPVVHHLDLHPYALKRFAASAEGRPLARFAEPYGRPSTALFQAHALRVVEEAGLQGLREEGEATGLHRVPGGWRVDTASGSLAARRVALALGPPPTLWPEWAVALRERAARVAHALDLIPIPEVPDVAVVGGGITAAQVALARAARHPGRVTLVMRHPPHLHELDADPGWMGPKRLSGFEAEPCPYRRRLALTAARHHGSVPPRTWAAVRRAEARGVLRVYEGAVREATLDGAGICLRIARPEASPFALPVQAVVLATGFAAERPGGAWLAASATAEGLPLAPCGFPALGPSLEWAPGLHVSGALAELVVGPVARNILGARMAAERIAVE
jgi:cation diffusion facilitator CzcD-associated flavoprotein CzcO